MAVKKYRKTAYLEGTAAKQLEYGFEAEKLPVRKKLSNSTRKNRERAFHMSLGYVMFLTTALLLVSVTLYGYLDVQSEITNSVKNISAMETQYNNLKLANDEEYYRIISSVDMEYIKSVAIGELGMTYAKEGQIVSIEDAGTDYVRQTADLR